MSSQRRKGLLNAFLGGICLAFCSAHANAQVLNGSFQSGTFQDWAHLGATTIQKSTLGTGPSYGSYEALIASATDSSVNANVPAANGATAAQLESYFKMQPGTLLGVGNGKPILVSGILQLVKLQPGQTVTFDWDFLTNQTYNDGTNHSVRPDAANDDFAFFAVVDPLNKTHLRKLADVFNGYNANGGGNAGFTDDFVLTSHSNPFVAETLFHTFTFTAAYSGDHRIIFGVVHPTTATQDNGVNSALLVDHIR